MFSGCPEFVSDLLPAIDDSYNLGSQSKRWKNLLLSGDVSLATLKTIIFNGDNDPLYGTLALRRHQFLTSLSIYKDYPLCTTYADLNVEGLYAALFGSTTGATRFMTLPGSNDGFFKFVTWLNGWRDIAYFWQDVCGFYDDNFLLIGKDSDGSLPPASSSYRGKMIRVEGGAGVTDKLYCCMKKADNSYEWVQVATG